MAQLKRSQLSNRANPIAESNPLHMVPRDLKPEQFATYSPKARLLAGQYLSTLQQLPLSFLSGLLREVIDCDFKFPVELNTLQKELSHLGSLSARELDNWFREFRQIHISSELENSNWVSAPAQFLEQLSAYLWSTHQVDAFRAAATAYADRLNKALPPEQPSIPRLGITIIGRDVAVNDSSLFRKLRVHGAYFSAVNPENGLQILLDAAAERAMNHVTSYGHWYIDGGQTPNRYSSCTCISYDSLAPARAALLDKMQRDIKRPGMGPEALRTSLAEMKTGDIGLNSEDPVLDHFKLKLLTEGSGTQIFSTTFVQWAAREALRRAQPLTLVVRFAPRQRQKPMNELLSPTSVAAELDAPGSLVDADMGAYYNWLNQQRLPGTAQSSFIAWFENHNCAVVIGPSIPRGTESTKATSVKELLAWVR